MLDHVRGDLVGVSEEGAVIAVGGIGLRLQMPTRDLAALQGSVTAYTVLQIRDDDVHLYGFSSERSRALFRALTSVSGVGPKVALAILSFHAPEALERAIATEDAGALALVPGIGKKIAQRLVLELKDKLGVGGEATLATGAMVEVREALKGLGYAPQEIQDAVAQLPPDGDAPTLLRFALRALGAKEMVG